MHLSCIGLFCTRPKLDHFWAKKNFFWFKPLFLSKILIALLVVFTRPDRVFKTNYTSHVQNDLKNAARLMRKSSVYFSASHFWLGPPLFRLLWRRYWSDTCQESSNSALVFPTIFFNNYCQTKSFEEMFILTTAILKFCFTNERLKSYVNYCKT